MRNTGKVKKQKSTEKIFEKAGGKIFQRFT
jgi:hypothetical protein